MEALTPDTLAWARRIGLTAERIAFLAACPKFTVCGEHKKHRRPISENPNRYLMRCGRQWYFRVHRSTGPDTVIGLGTDLDAARIQRDALLCPSTDALAGARVA